MTVYVYGTFYNPFPIHQEHGRRVHNRMQITVLFIFFLAHRLVFFTVATNSFGIVWLDFFLQKANNNMLSCI
jgi:hypothetical protein